MRAPPLRHRPFIKAAAELIASLDIRAPGEIDVELIAAHCGAAVEYKLLSTEEGRLLRHGKTGLIAVNSETQYTAKSRFIIAHELGHFLCHTQLNQLSMCTDESLHEWYQSSGHEPEANRFAAELLMPETLFKKACDTDRPSLSDVQGLAAQYSTSLTATALRFVEFCPEPVALVLSQAGQIEWFSRGEEFKVFLSKGYALAKGTYAADLYACREVPAEMADVRVDAWNSGEFEPDVELHEQSIPLGKYGVMSLLWHRASNDDD